MKTRTLLVIPIFIFVVVAIFFFASCTTTGNGDGAETPGGTSTISGTWVNPDYDGEGYPAKAVVTDNGDGTFTVVMYITVSDTEPFGTVTMTVTNQWTDPEENLFLEVEGIESDELIYELIKIHADNQTMEVNISYDGYPTEIDPDSEEYQIYYRQ